MNKPLVLALLVFLIPTANADQGSFNNAGGSTSVSPGVGITSSVADPAGPLNLSCSPGTGSCSGGSFSFVSADGTISITGSFTSGTNTESCSGGGRGGHITCSYSFVGYISGTLTANGQTQAITGVTSQVFGTGGAGASGTTAYNSAYAPFYYSDSGQILRSDDLLGTNQIAFGTMGSDAGQFYGAYGIALDSAGRIYVADTYNCRVVRIDDMNGTNWTTYGDASSCGSGQGQFYDPSGIAVDAAGRIYVMDTGNSRLVRIDDMNGNNWISYGTAGSDVDQFASFTSVAIDASGRIYVADTGNLRIVRFDDMSGTNWTVLTQSPPVNGISYSFQSPVAVALDLAGRIYVADNQSVVRVDDMTGANWTAISTGSTSGPNSIAVDSGGTVMTGGGGVHFVDNMAAVLASSGDVIAPYGSYYVFGITPVPVPAPRPSAVAILPAPPGLSFTQNVGTASAPQPVTISNFGGSVLNLGGIQAAGPFTQTSNCPTVLVPGSNCSVSVSFSPSVPGAASGTLSFSDDSGNLGASQSVALSGFGTVPVASVTPATLSFSNIFGTTSAVRKVTLNNTGDGPMQIASIAVAAPFGQTNTCGTGLSPGASCTISVSFTPAVLGAVSGTLTITDDAGTQSVGLTGTGTAPVTLSSSILNFGKVTVGSTSAAKTVTVTNRQSVPLNFSGISASGDFAVASTTCGASLGAGARCSVGVTFTPTVAGAETGALTIGDDALNSPQTVNLTGTGSTGTSGGTGD